MKKTFFKSDTVSGVAEDRVLVFLDGLQATSMRPGHLIARTLVQKSNALLLSAVYPDGRGFAKKRLVSDIYWRIAGYPRVTLIGVSSGALLAHDVISYAKQHGEDHEWDLIAVDGLSGPQDVLDERARWFRYLPALPLPGWVNSQIFSSDTPATEELDKKSREEWEEHLRRSHSFKFNTWVRQGRYFMNHPGPCYGVMDDVNTVFLRSYRDPFVRRDAYRPFQDVCERFIKLDIAEGSEHGNLLEFPRLWSGAFSQALDVLEHQRAA